MSSVVQGKIPALGWGWRQEEDWKLKVSLTSVARLYLKHQKENKEKVTGEYSLLSFPPRLVLSHPGAPQANLESFRSGG